MVLRNILKKLGNKLEGRKKMEKNNLLKRFQSFLYYLSEKTEYKKDKNLNEDKYKIKLITLRNMILRELIYLVDEENQDIKKNIC